MSEKPLPFVITDRRKFTTDGQPREGAELSPSPEPAAEPEVRAEAHSANVVEMPAPPEPEPAPAVEPDAAEQASGEDEELPPAPTAEQMQQSLKAFQATAERLDLAVRAANPGAEHPPAISFESLVQSVYMQAVLQLGGGTPQGEQPQVDIFGARQSIEMLGILAEKTAGNLDQREDLLLSSALFELRLAFLDLTQALARSAQQRNPGAPGTPPAPGGRPGPNLVR
jgi:hypothetical protein